MLSVYTLSLIRQKARSMEHPLNIILRHSLKTETYFRFSTRPYVQDTEWGSISQLIDMRDKLRNYHTTKRCPLAIEWLWVPCVFDLVTKKAKISDYYIDYDLEKILCIRLKIIYFDFNLF